MAEDKQEVMYGYTRDGADSYSDGPTADIKEILKNRPAPNDPRPQIHKFYGEKTIVSHEWDGSGWVALTPEDIKVNPTRADDPQDDIAPDPFGSSPVRSLILEAAGIDEKDQVKLVTLRVEGFTVEAKAGEYQAVRGYLMAAPQGLSVHVAVHDPARLVDDVSDAEIFASAFKHVANMLDMAIVEVANRRADRAVLAADQKTETANKRFGGKEGPTQKYEEL